MYRVANNDAKRSVGRAKRLAWQEWSDDLHTTEGQQKMYRLAKQMRRDRKDVLGSNFIKDENGAIKIDSAEAVDRWKRYFHQLLNEETEYSIEETYPVQGLLEQITSVEVVAALESMKDRKAAGPTEVTSELIKYVGGQGVDYLTEVFQGIAREGRPPIEWGMSITVPLYKGVGDALECGKYRGLRLLEHGMKIWEKVLLQRLRAIVNVSEQQFGFQKGRSTTDAIFILRQLQEKYCRKKRPLYHIFVDMEKAFDRVPRPVIEWALRKQSVMALYSCSSSKVRFAGVDSVDFPIGVGVHQGSALSPLLFVLVIEEASKSCRRGHPWELLYADDIVLTADSKERVEEMFRSWREALLSKGLKVNLAKATEEVITSGRYPCAVCGSGV